jgi:hypothetical protein
MNIIFQFYMNILLDATEHLLELLVLYVCKCLKCITHYMSVADYMSSMGSMPSLIYALLLLV